MLASRPVLVSAKRSDSGKFSKNTKTNTDVSELIGHILKKYFSTDTQEIGNFIPKDILWTNLLQTEEKTGRSIIYESMKSDEIFSPPAVSNYRRAV